MRSLLRRRLQEVSEDQWTDQQLNDLLNLGLYEVQKYIIRINPDYNLSYYQANVVADQDLYDLPASLIRLDEVQLKDSSGNYYTITKTDAKIATRMIESNPLQQNTQTNFFLRGRYLGLSPVPTSSVTGGLRLWGVFTLTMAANEDVPKIPLNVHLAPVLYAHYLALAGETGEVEAAKESLAAFKDQMASLAELIGAAEGGPNYLIPDFDSGTEIEAQ